MNMEVDLPEGWRKVNLGQVCDKILGGGTPSTKVSEYWNGTIPWISSADIHGLKDISLTRAVTTDAIKNSAANILPKGGIIVVTRVGLGKIAIAPCDISFSQDNQGLVLNKSLITQPYALLCLSQAVQVFKRQSRGTTINGVTKKQLVELEIPLPPLDEQHQIVEKIEELFSELDKGIENLKTAQQQLKVYRQAVLKWAFEGKLIIDNDKWKNYNLGDIIAGFQNGLSKRNSEEGLLFNVLRLADIKEGNINSKTPRQIKLTDNEIDKYKIHDSDLLVIRVNGSRDLVGRFIAGNGHGHWAFCDHFIRVRPNQQLVDPIFFKYFTETQVTRKYIEDNMVSSAGQNTISQTTLSNIEISLPTIKTQKQIVEEIESRLSVCDKTEETINTSLQQAEALRQSILKRAFEGKLVRVEVKPVYKPKNIYFYQVQVLGMIAAASKEKGISHGEMTIAKYSYLLDKVYQIPTYYNYQRWHLGPYPPEMKKAITNKKFFNKINSNIEVLDFETLTKYTNPYTEKLKNAIDDLVSILSAYPAKERSHQTELLATVCKVIEDIQSIDLQSVRQSMSEWVIDLSNTHFKNKAEKFSEEETRECINIIIERAWVNKLILKPNI